MTEAPISSQREPIQWSRVLPIFFNYLIVALMLTCATGALVGVIQALAPRWNGAYVLIVCFIVAIEAQYTARIMRRIHFPSREWVSYRVGEVVTILILLKALIYLMRGPGQLLADLQLWQQDFLINFFNGEYLLACVMVIAVYLVSNQLCGDLYELEADDEKLERERKNDFRNDRAGLHKQLTLKVVLIAAVMIIVTLLGRTYLRIRGDETAAAGINAYGLLVYVMLGFLLLSLARYSALRAAWFRERAPISSSIARRWPLYAIGLLILVALVVIVLPTHYSIGLLQMLRLAAGALVSLLQFLIYFILLVITFPLSLLMRLLGGSSVTPNPPPSPAQMMPPLTPDQPAGANPLLEMIQSLLFWAIFLFIVGYALTQFFRRHGALLETLRSIPILAWLIKGFSALSDLLRKLSGQLTLAIDAGLKRMRASADAAGSLTQPSRRLNLRRLSPRERVQYFYLAMVRRGGEHGLGRKPAQTPREYAATLDAAVTEANAEIDSLTDAFIEARYSRHDITPDHASTVQSWWERVKAALRKK